jgi:hypothetical protein
MRAYCSPDCSGNIELQYSHVVSNNALLCQGISGLPVLKYQEG